VPLVFESEIFDAEPHNEVLVMRVNISSVSEQVRGQEQLGKRLWPSLGYSGATK